MTREEIITYIWRGFALFGGVAFVAGAVASFVAKLFADRSLEAHKASLSQETEKLKAELGKDAETHKWNLKRKEILFQKEIEAASEFFELHRKLEPKFRHPDMDWYEAAEDVVEGFSGSEERLTKFISTHGPVLSAKIRSVLDECKQLATNHKFARHEGGIKKEDEDAAEKFLKLLNDIEAQFVIELRT